MARVSSRKAFLVSMVLMAKLPVTDAMTGQAMGRIGNLSAGGMLLLSDRVAARARAAGVMGRTVQVTVRFADFTTVQRSRTLQRPSDVSREIHQVAREVFASLVGVMRDELEDSDRGETGFGSSGTR